MTTFLPRKDAVKLQFQIADTILERKEHPGICATIFALSEAWIIGEALPIAERQALAAAEAAQAMPEYLTQPYMHPHRLKDYEALERKYRLDGINPPEFATCFDLPNKNFNNPASGSENPGHNLG